MLGDHLKWILFELRENRWEKVLKRFVFISSFRIYMFDQPHHEVLSGQKPKRFCINELPDSYLVAVFAHH